MYSSDDYEQGYNKDYDYNSYDTDFGAHSGDATVDNDFNRQYFKMPELVVKFLKYFCECVRDRQVFELQNLYEGSWPKLTEEFFEKRPWPEETDVMTHVNKDPVFMILYKELYFRHIYARIQGGPTLEQRFNSFYNYCDLFNYILSEAEPVSFRITAITDLRLVSSVFIHIWKSFSSVPYLSVYRLENG